jgi:hypothetical protein
MHNTFPEFTNTSTKTPKMDMIPASEVQTYIKAELAKQSPMNTDSWANVLVGLSGRADKSKYTEHNGVNIVDDAVLTGVYMNEGLGGRIVDVVADDMTREWITFDEQAPQETVDKLTGESLRLDIEERFNEALRWRRLYGGSLIIIGAMDGQRPDMPLKEKLNAIS